MPTFDVRNSRSGVENRLLIPVFGIVMMIIVTAAGLM